MDKELRYYPPRTASERLYRLFVGVHWQPADGSPPKLLSERVDDALVAELEAAAPPAGVEYDLEPEDARC